MVKIEQLTDFTQGSVPVIISVPHGGSLKCDNIPKRSSGVLGVDKDTIELAQELIYKIRTFSEESFPINPSYLISNVHRSRIDLNREETEAFNQKSDIAREIYWAYHNKIKKFISNNITNFNRSLLIDIHGFEKHKRPQGYRDVELILGTNNLQSLFSNSVPKKDWDYNIRGKIIKKFLTLGIPIAPGHPRRKEYVLKGGFITKKYGASHIPKSQALQIEFSDQIRFFDQQLREKVLSTLAEIICGEIK